MTLESPLTEVELAEMAERAAPRGTAVGAFETLTLPRGHLHRLVAEVRRLRAIMTDRALAPIKDLDTIEDAFNSGIFVARYNATRRTLNFLVLAEHLQTALRVLAELRWLREGAWIEAVCQEIAADREISSSSPPTMENVIRRHILACPSVNPETACPLVFRFPDRCL
jgi:hypothetical protein